VHEGFGHGSGKLRYEKKGKCPIEWTDAVNGEIFTSCYDEGENYSLKFGEFKSSFEECRADLSGLYL